MDTPQRHGTNPYDYDKLAHTWQALRLAEDQDAIDELLDPLTDADWKQLMEAMERHYPLDPMQTHMDPFKIHGRYKELCDTDKDALFLTQVQAMSCKVKCHVCADFMRLHPPTWME